MTDQNNPTGAEIDALLAELAAAEPEPGQALLNRMMADAEAVSAVQFAPVPKSRPSVWSEILAAIGGWGAVAGLSTATFAGVWLGIAPPDAMPDVSQWFLNDSTISVLDGFNPNFDSLLDEG